MALRRPKTQATLDDRARWLAELARAVDEAQQLVWRLAALRGDNVRSSEIYGQLEAARDEIERLQRSAKLRARVNLQQSWSELMTAASACATALD